MEMCEMGMVEGRLKRIRKRTVFMKTRRPLTNTPDGSIMLCLTMGDHN